MNWLEVSNSLFLGLSQLIILGFFTKRPSYKEIRCLIFIIIEDYLIKKYLWHVSSLSIMLIILFSACILDKKISLNIRIAYSTLAISALQVMVLFIGPLLYLCNLINYTDYIFPVVAVLYAIVLRFKVINCCKQKNYSLIRYLLYLALFMLIFFNIVLKPLPLRDDLYSLAYISFAFAFLIILGIWFIAKIAAAEKELNQAEHEIDRLKGTMQMLKYRSKALTAFKHYYGRLYSNLLFYINKHDFAGLKRYFFDTISPQDNNLQNAGNQNNMLSLIDNEILKLNLYRLMADSKQKNFSVDLSLNTTYYPINLDDINLHKALSILITNAVEEVENQDAGTIEILLNGNKDCFLFQIENSILNRSLRKPNNSHNGLNILNNILASNPQMKLNTYINKIKYIQLLTIENE